MGKRVTTTVSQIGETSQWELKIVLDDDDFEGTTTETFVHESQAEAVAAADAYIETL